MIYLHTKFPAVHYVPALNRKLHRLIDFALRHHVIHSTKGENCFEEELPQKISGFCSRWASSGLGVLTSH
jgi:hypothetical protein